LPAAALIVTGSNNMQIAGVPFFITGIVVYTWLVAISLLFLSETHAVGH
jgi:hypothetical protein